MAVDDGFRTVGRRGGKPNKKYTKPLPLTHPERSYLSNDKDLSSNTPQRYKDTTSLKFYSGLSLMDKIKHCKEIIGNSTFYDDLKSALKFNSVAAGGGLTSNESSLSIVCLGIGCISSSVNSQYQMGLLLLLIDLLKVHASRVEVFEPLFVDEDLRLIRQLKFSVSTNKIGRHKADCPTLFYMPHCAEGLYNNLLIENWNFTQLPHLLILGNSFYNYCEKSHSVSKMIKKVVPKISEYPLSVVGDGNVIEMAFCNSSLHIVERKKLCEKDELFWLVEEELMVGGEVVGVD